MAHCFLGDVASALRPLKGALDLNPDDTDIMTKLGMRYAILAKWERAVPLLEGSYTRKPAHSLGIPCRTRDLATLARTPDAGGRGKLRPGHRARRLTQGRRTSP